MIRPLQQHAAQLTEPSVKDSVCFWNIVDLAWYKNMNISQGVEWITRALELKCKVGSWIKI